MEAIECFMNVEIKVFEQKNYWFLTNENLILQELIFQEVQEILQQHLRCLLDGWIPRIQIATGLLGMSHVFIYFFQLFVYIYLKYIYFFTFFQSSRSTCDSSETIYRMWRISRIKIFAFITSFQKYYYRRNDSRHQIPNYVYISGSVRRRRNRSWWN